MSNSKTNAERKPTSTIIKGYLILYNVVLFVAWAVVLALLVGSIVENAGNYEDGYNVTGRMLQIAQTAALMELLHSQLGLVQSPVLTTALQLLSRLYLVWPILAIFPEVGSHWAFSTMTIAWSVTEVVRYSYYVFNLFGWIPELLLWCRYNFFLILYPMGATSEFILVYNSLEYSNNVAFHYIRLVGLATYFPGFHTMYTHMIYQRSKYMRRNKQDKKEN